MFYIRCNCLALNELTRKQAYHYNNSKGSFLIPVRGLVDMTDKVMKVKFIFDRTLRVPDFEYVIADNEHGYVRMITSKGTEFSTGSLFDQLFDWYDYIFKN